jgi:carboxymethylenebutenolidase
VGARLEFSGSDTTGEGYLATPSERGPGLIVIQEWWGLVPHIERVCDRFAEAGFVTLAPDLYRGQTTTEPDEAAKAMMALRLEAAGEDMSAAVDELRRRATGPAVGVIGFCMGGGLALLLASNRPDAVGAVVACYGVIPWPEAQPDYSAMTAAALIHCAAEDASFPPETAVDLGHQLKALGKEAEVVIHPGADHAFFNDDRPEVYHRQAAERLWETSVAFLLNHLA